MLNEYRIHLQTETDKTNAMGIHKLLLIGVFLNLLTSINAQIFFTQNGNGSANGTSWDNAYPASQLANIVNTTSEETIYLASGSYVLQDNITITGKSISIIGGFPSDAAGTDISGYNPTANISIISPSVSQTLTVNGADGKTVTFKGFEITGFTKTALTINGGVGVNTFSINLVELNCHGNSGDFGGVGSFSLFTGDNTKLLIDRCYFASNTSSGNAGVFYFTSCYKTTPGVTTGVPGGDNHPFIIENSTFVSNSAIAGNCFFFSLSSDFDVRNNRFCSNISTILGAVISFSSSNRMHFSDNVFRNNVASNAAFGEVFDCDRPKQPGNVAENNIFYNNGTGLDLVMPAGTDVAYFQLNNNQFSKSAADQSYSSDFTATGNSFSLSTDPGACPTFEEALPLIFGTVDAKFMGNKLSVHWQSFAEENVTHYNIELSNDGKKFIRLDDKILAQGGISAYSFEKHIDSITYGSLGLASLLLLSIPFVYRRRNRLLITVSLLLLSAFFYACQKNDSASSARNNNDLFVRVVGVDKDNAETVSKIVKASVE